MAVVKTITCQNGVTVRVHDDLYAGITKEEMNRRISEITELAQKIMLNAEARKLREINGSEKS